MHDERGHDSDKKRPGVQRPPSSTDNQGHFWMRQTHLVATNAVEVQQRGSKMHLPRGGGGCTQHGGGRLATGEVPGCCKIMLLGASSATACMHAADTLPVTTLVVSRRRARTLPASTAATGQDTAATRITISLRFPGLPQVCISNVTSESSLQQLPRRTCRQPHTQPSCLAVLPGTTSRPKGH